MSNSLQSPSSGSKPFQEKIRKPQTSASVISTPERKAKKLKRDNKSALVSKYTEINWKSISIDNAYIKQLAAIQLKQGESAPSDKHGFLTLAFNAFGPLILNYILLSSGITPEDFPSAKKDKIQLLVRTVLKRSSLTDQGVTSGKSTATKGDPKKTSLR